MKNEIRVAANEIAVTALRDAMGDKIVPVRVSKKNGFAFDTGVKDENGKPVYVVFEATVKVTEDNKTGSIKAFDLEAAVQELLDYENAPKKEAKPKKEADPEAEAKRAKRETQKQALHDWLTDNLTEEAMTTTDIQGACAEIADVPVTQVGTWMTAIAREDSSIKRDVVKGKPYYSKA
jgi:hypothetical protein